MMGELSFLLGLQVKQQYKGIFINQSKYIIDILKKYSLQDCKPAKTPMSTAVKIWADPDGKHINTCRYRGMIGSLFES